MAIQFANSLFKIFAIVLSGNWHLHLDQNLDPQFKKYFLISEINKSDGETDQDLASLINLDEK